MRCNHTLEHKQILPHDQKNLSCADIYRKKGCVLDTWKQLGFFLLLVKSVFSSSVVHIIHVSFQLFI